MKKNISILFILFQCFFAFSQKPTWTSHFTGTGENYPFQSAIDKNDNVYIIGSFKGSVNQAPGQGITKTLTSKGDYDVFVSKYDKNGTLIWLRQIGGNLIDAASSITRDDANQEIWIGLTSTSASLTDEDNNLVTNASAGGLEEAILISLSYADGTFRVKKRMFLDSYRHRFSNLRIDSANRIVVLGFFNTRIKFSATDSLTATGTNFYVARFDRNGNFIKSKLIDSPTSSLNSISILDKSSYVFSGRSSNKLKIGTDSITIPAGNLNDIILFKLDTNLNFIANSFRKIGGPGADMSLSVSNDKNRNTYVSGYFASTYLTIDSTATLPAIDRGSITVPINKGGNDLVFAMYDSLFNLKWINYGGTAGDDQMSRIVSNDNSVMIGGRFGAPKLVFKNDSIINYGSTDGLTIIMDKYNNLVYLLGFGATGAEVIETGQITSEGNFIVIGRFTSAQLIIGNDTLNNPNADKDMVILQYAKASLNMWVNQIVCPGANDGSVAAIPKGTTMAPYSYAWTKKGDATFNSTEQYIYNLSAGRYYVTFHDNLGFTTYDSVDLVNPGTTAVSVSVGSVTNTTCYSGNDGKIDITAANGYGGYLYSWVALSGSGVIPTAQDQLALTKGSYKVTVTDSKGCKTTSNNIGISEPAQITLDMTISDESIVGGSDGSVIMNITNGVPVFTHAWTKVNDIIFSESTKDITSLDAGIYNVLVTDSKGCKANGSATVRDPNEFAVSLASTPVSCKNADDGTLKASIAGNPSGITYTWTKIGDPGFSAPNSDSISGLAPGTYKLDVTNGTKNGSNQTDISEPAEFKITAVTVTDIDCYGTATGSIDPAITGGILPYTYNWTKNGTPGYSASSANLIEVIAGTYNYTATDARGCIADSSITIDQTDSMDITAQIQPVSCYGETYDGYIHQTIDGGNPSYTYLWSTGLSSKNIDFLRPGAYYCTIKDLKLCRTTKRYIIDEPGTFYGDFTIKNASCYGKKDGSVEIKITGGNAPYKFLWNTPKADTIAKLDSLNSGKYSVLVKDSKKCESEFEMPISITKPDSLILSIDSIADENLGLDGLIHTSATGGTAPYNFLLLPVGTNNTTGLFNALAANKYILYLSDKNLCGPIKSDTLTILPNPLDLKSSSELYSASVYPNPNNGVFTLLIYGTNSEYKVTVVNSTGQVAIEKTYYSKDFLSEFNMNLSHLAKGIYFLKINNSSAVKVMIQ